MRYIILNHAMAMHGLCCSKRLVQPLSRVWLKIIDTQTWIKMDAVRYNSMTLFFFVASDVLGILQQIKLGVVRVAAVSARQGTSSRKCCHTSSWPMHVPSSSPQLDAETTSPSWWCYLVFKPLGVSCYIVQNQLSSGPWGIIMHCFQSCLPEFV